MSLPLLIVVTIIYAGVAFDQFCKGSVGTGWMFTGYTIANLGLMKLV